MNVLKPQSRFALPAAGLLLLSLAMSSRAQAPDSISGFLPSHVETERQLERKFRGIPDAAHAESDLRHLTSEPHMAGTEASRQRSRMAARSIQSFGFDAEIVTYSAWLPQPREVTLEFVKPENKKLASPEAAYRRR